MDKLITIAATELLDALPKCEHTPCTTIAFHVGSTLHNEESFYLCDTHYSTMATSLHKPPVELPYTKTAIRLLALLSKIEPLSTK